MKNIHYSFSFPLQLTIALTTFILNTGIPLLLDEPISWLGTTLASIGVFFSSGLRFGSSGKQK